MKKYLSILLLPFLLWSCEKKEPNQDRGNVYEYDNTSVDYTCTLLIYKFGRGVADTFDTTMYRYQNKNMVSNVKWLNGVAEMSWSIECTELD